MKISAESGGKITVVLSFEDIKSIGIPLKEMNSADPDIRLIMNALYRAASEKIGLRASSQKLLIEAHPTLGGGGVLYFTPLIPKIPLEIKARKSAPQTLIYEFSDGSALLDCISFLYPEEEIKNIKSSLFFDQKAFFLVIEKENDSEKLRAAREFCDNFYVMPKKNFQNPSFIIAKENAILEIGKRIKAI